MPRVKAAAVVGHAYALRRALAVRSPVTCTGERQYVRLLGRQYVRLLGRRRICSATSPVKLYRGNLCR